MSEKKIIKEILDILEICITQHDEIVGPIYQYKALMNNFERRLELYFNGLKVRVKQAEDMYVNVKGQCDMFMNKCKRLEKENKELRACCELKYKKTQQDREENYTTEQQFKKSLEDLKKGRYRRVA
jgi:hypothetical protein